VDKEMSGARIIGRFAETGTELLFVEQDGRIAGAIYLEDLLKELTP
jgi:high-affinity K+ transport system ATPase subunit B